MPTQELGISLPCQPIPAPGKENPGVLFACAPARTATTTLFFSKPKITVSGFPSQVTSATVTDLLSHLNRWVRLAEFAYSNLRLGYLCTRRHSEKMEAMKNILKNFTSKLRSRSPQFQGSSRGQAISLITLYWGVVFLRGG